MDGAEELELGDMVPLRGPLGALKGTDPVTTGILSVRIRGVEVEVVLSKLKGTEDEIKPDAAVAEELCVADRRPLVLLNENPPEATEELAPEVPEAPLVIELGVIDKPELGNIPEAAVEETPLVPPPLLRIDTGVNGDPDDGRIPESNDEDAPLRPLPPLMTVIGVKPAPEDEITPDPMNELAPTIPV